LDKRACFVCLFLLVFYFFIFTDRPLCAPGGYVSAAVAQQCMTNGNGPAAGSPLAAGRTTGSPTNGPPSMQTIGAGGGGQPGAQNQQNGPSNPMAALMSVADNLPPSSPQSARGSPPGSIGPTAQAPGGPRSASRGSQHSPNSTGMYFYTPNPSIHLRRGRGW